MKCDYITKRGVYLDLDKSPYEVKYFGKVYKFSSQAKLEKFDSQIRMAQAKLSNLNEKIRNIAGTGVRPSEQDRIEASLYDFVYNNMELK